MYVVRSVAVYVVRSVVFTIYLAQYIKGKAQKNSKETSIDSRSRVNKKVDHLFSKSIQLIPLKRTY